MRKRNSEQFSFSHGIEKDNIVSKKVAERLGFVRAA